MKVERTLVCDGSSYNLSDGDFVLCCEKLRQRFDLEPEFPGQAILAVFRDKPGRDPALRLKYQAIGMVDQHGHSWDCGALVGQGEEFCGTFRALDEILRRFPRRTAWLSIYPLEVQP